MRRHGLILLITVLLFFMTGCRVKAEKDLQLLSTLAELQAQVEQEEWDIALAKADDFQQQYQKRKWKLQLLGEQEDYKEIELELITLREALKDEDGMEAKTSVNQIMHRLRIIYRL